MRFTAVYLFVCLSVCEHNNSRTRLRMSTKHGRRDPLENFGVDPNPDVDR